MVLNEAFVFIKPHAVTPATILKVESMLTAFGLTITDKGTKTAAEIEAGQLIDTHYYAIASKATLLKPHQLNVPADAFEAKFGTPWAAALENGQVYNALDASAKLALDAPAMNKLWAATKSAGKMIKFGGGFYCGEVAPGMFVFNGFFMQMRATYVADGKSIAWYTVQWDEAALSWADFRAKVLGPTDPADAPETSIRGTILREYEALGLAAKPNTGDNGVHASASPFEALAERSNWLAMPVEDQAVGKALLDAGITKDTIDAWCKDPAVTNGETGGVGSLWDQLEDRDTTECLKLLLPGFASGAGATKVRTLVERLSVKEAYPTYVLGTVLGLSAGVVITRLMRH